MAGRLFRLDFVIILKFAHLGNFYLLSILCLFRQYLINWLGISDLFDTLKNTPGHTKIADLDIALRVYEDISRLDITVHNMRSMHELESAECVIDNCQYVILGKSVVLSTGYQVAEVVAKTLLYQEYLREFEIGDGGAAVLVTRIQ